jgi:uncharacterized membrane protein
MEGTELENRIGLGQGTPVPPPERKASGMAGQLTGAVRDASPHQLARGLGWFSIGLGLAEVLMPYAVARLCGGTGRHTGLIRLYGLRELASGVAILSGGKRPVTGMWSRVAGDAIDLATLGLAFASPRSNKAGVAFATANVVAVTALDVHCAQELSKETGLMTPEGAIRHRHSIAINRPPEELYNFWKDVQNLPRFMYHLESVQPIDDRHSHWVTKGPAGTRVEWDAETTEDRPNELLAWQTVGGTKVQHSGVVRFEPRPGGRGTIVRVEMEYKPLGGMAGAAFARLFGESPEQQIYDDLRRLKQVIETGEVLRSDGSPEGTGQVRQRPAQPMPGSRNLSQQQDTSIPAGHGEMRTTLPFPE